MIQPFVVNRSQVNFLWVQVLQHITTPKGTWGRLELQPSWTKVQANYAARGWCLSHNHEVCKDPLC